MERKYRRDERPIRPRMETPHWLLIIVAAIPVVQWVGSSAMFAHESANNVATKRDLEDVRQKISEQANRTEEAIQKVTQAIQASLDAANKFTEARVAQADTSLKQYSDLNRKGMENEFAPISTKVDMIYKALMEGGGPGAPRPRRKMAEE